MFFRKFCLILILSAITSIVFAQPGIDWSRTFGGEGSDWCNDMIRTANGGFALAGGSYSFGMGRKAFYIVKTNEGGEVRWSRAYGDEGRASCLAVIQLEDGGYALAGNKEGIEENDNKYRLIRIDDFGEVLWSREFLLPGICYSLCRTAENGFLMAGVAISPDGNDIDGVILNVSADGDSLWTRYLGGDGSDFFNNVIVTSGGGYLLIGGSDSFEGEGIGGYLVLLDIYMEEQWSNCFGGNYRNSFNTAVEVNDGGYALAGNSFEMEDENSDCQIVRINPEGELLWRSNFGSVDIERCNSIIETNDHCFLLAGEREPSNDNDNSDIYLVKSDNRGREVWSGVYGGDEDEACSSVIQLENGCFVMAGRTMSYGEGGRDMWMVKTGADPVSVSEKDNRYQPTEFNLLHAYPNPFNAQTIITFELPTARYLSLSVHDAIGQRVGALADGSMIAGLQSITWDANGLPSGLYFINLEYAGNTISRQLVLRK